MYTLQIAVVWSQKETQYIASIWNERTGEWLRVASGSTVKSAYDNARYQFPHNRTQLAHVYE